MTRATRILAAKLFAVLLAGCGDPPPDWGPGASPPPPNTGPIGLQSALRLGEAAAAGGDMASAVNILGAAAAKHPADPAPRRALAETYFRAGAYPEARRSWTEFRGLSGTPSEAELGLGRVALATGDPGAAETHFRAALAAAPDSLAAMNGIAVALDLRGRHAEARRMYDAALAREPDNRAVLSNRALSMALAGETAAAVRALDDLARGPARLPQAPHNLALAYALDGRQRQAGEILAAELPRDQAEANLAFYRRLRR